MKTLFLFPIGFLLMMTASGQNKLAFFAGPQTTSAYYKVQDVKQETSMKVGFQVGGNLKIPFESKLFFAPTAFYSLKGYKVNFTRFTTPPDVDAKDNNTTIHTFEVAPLLQFDFNNDPGHFYIKMGPSMDIQLFGKESFHLVSNDDLVSRNMKFSFSDYGYVSFNLLSQLGYETSGGFMIFIQHSLGLGSISNADYGPKIHHRVLGLSVGKYLNRK